MPEIRQISRVATDRPVGLPFANSSRLLPLQLCTIVVQSICEQKRRELVQTAAPGLPLVRRPLRLVHDVLDPGLVESLVHLLDAGRESLLGGTGPQPQEAGLLVERGRVP